MTQEEENALYDRIALLQENMETLRKNDQVLRNDILALADGRKEDQARIETLETELRDNPLPKHLDVWNYEMRYTKNNTVTYHGSTWLCKVASTKDVPGGPEGAWVLTAKRGRDGKDAKHYAVA